MDWRERFEAPVVTKVGIAADRPDRGVVISDVDQRFQAHAWDRSTGELRRVTASDAAVINAAISADGESIYAMVEDEPGREVGHIHRFDFETGDSMDLTPDLESYTAFGLHPTAHGVIAVAGIGGESAVLVIDPDLVRPLVMPTMITDLRSKDGLAAVTMATPGKGMTPMLRLVDLSNGETRAGLSSTRGGPIHDGRVAVAQLKREWLRPGVWDGVTFDQLEVDLPGDVIPVDWWEGTSLLLTQSYRSRVTPFVYHLDTGALSPLATPPGSAHPWSDPVLTGPDTAICVWSDATRPWHLVELSPDGHEVALVIDGQRSFSGPLWEEFTYTSTDDAEIQGWLMRLPGDGPWPTVIYTHGGPSSVAGPIFSPICSAWFDAGFAVASINYRGSTTFGQSFREALTGKIGGPDIDDVVAGWHWLVDHGIADPDKVVKNGYSYGGFLTLQSLGTHPDLWAAGVAGAPIADWAVNYEDSNDMLKSYDLSLFGGPPDDLPDQYRMASPRTYAADFDAPLLISQPATDSRTPLRQVQVFVDDLLAKDKMVDLRVLAGGHAGSGKTQTIEMVESWLDFARPIVGLGEAGD
ncbi:MAG: prolyl oligopeptidase family serine peptidase [Acidimicrobiia bacterium]